MNESAFPVPMLKLIPEMPILNGYLMHGNLNTAYSLSVIVESGETKEHALGRFGSPMSNHGRPEICLRDILRAIADMDKSKVWKHFDLLCRRIRAM